MITNVLAAIGLLLDIVGVFIIYKNEIKPRINQTIYLHARDEIEKINAEKAKNEHDRKRRSMYGLWLIMLGFLFQLVAATLPLLYKIL